MVFLFFNLFLFLVMVALVARVCRLAQMCNPVMGWGQHDKVAVG